MTGGEPPPLAPPLPDALGIPPAAIIVVVPPDVTTVPPPLPITAMAPPLDVIPAPGDPAAPPRNGAASPFPQPITAKARK